MISVFYKIFIYEQVTPPTPPPKKRDKRQIRGDATKQTLIEAGIKLFGEHGFSGTSTRGIARQAGVNLGLISFHFGTKERLYR